MTQALRTRMGDESGLHANLKFDCGDEGVIYLDGRSTPNQVHNDNLEADCTVTISRANLEALMTRQLDPAMGFMMGKLKVSGDMSVALKLQKVM